MPRTLFWLPSTLLLAVACFHAYTPQQLEHLGTHRLAGKSIAQAVEITAVALETLGYRVTVKNTEQGIVKTAPRTTMTSASGGSNYANVTEDGLAWVIAISGSSSSAVLHATPRGFRNGSEMRGEGIWVAEVMDQKFADLWNEVDEAAGGGR
jgi:hypothetical protein